MLKQPSNTHLPPLSGCHRRLHWRAAACGFSTVCTSQASKTMAGTPQGESSASAGQVWPQGNPGATAAHHPSGRLHNFSTCRGLREPLRLAG